MMEGLVRHHQLAKPLQKRIVGVGVKACERTHGQSFDQHLHADELFPNERRADHFDQKIAERRPHRNRRAPAQLDIFGEGGDVARFFPRLVRGVFLCARIFQDVAERCGQRECPLFPMQDGGHGETHTLVHPLHLLLFVQPVADRGLQIEDHVRRHEIFVVEIPRLIETDIFLVERIPEMVVRGRNDLVERGGTLAVTFHFQHRRKVVRIGGVVSRVLGDVHVHAVSPN